MSRHSKAEEAVKLLKKYCEDTENCGKCVLFPVCNSGYRFNKKQIEDVNILRKRLEREDLRKVSVRNEMCGL